MSRRPTQQDIADRAGVSRALVWSVLTGRSSHIRAGPETRARIKRIANEVGYRPRSMPAGTAIGVVLWRFKVDQLVQDFWLPFLQGIEGALRNSGFDFLLLGQSEQEEPAQRARRYAAEGRLASLIVPGHLEPKAYEELAAITQVPLVGAFPGDRELPITWIDVDDARGIRDGLALLHRHGHRRIAYLEEIPAKAEADPIRRRRNAAFVAACEEFEIEPRVHRVDLSGLSSRPNMRHPLEDEPLLAAAVPQLRALLARDERPSALLCGMEPLAFAAYVAAGELDLAIPHDLSVLAFDDRYAVAADPPLSAISHMLTEVGVVVGKRASECAGELPAEEGFRRQVIAPTITERASIAPPPRGMREGSGRREAATSDR